MGYPGEISSRRPLQIARSRVVCTTVPPFFSKPMVPRERPFGTISATAPLPTSAFLRSQLADFLLGLLDSNRKMASVFGFIYHNWRSLFPPEVPKAPNALSFGILGAAHIAYEMPGGRMWEKGRDGLG